MEQQEQERQPSKEQIRRYMASRQEQQCPPPSIMEIRRQLGWGLLHHADDERHAAT